MQDDQTASTEDYAMKDLNSLSSVRSNVGEDLEDPSHISVAKERRFLRRLKWFLLVAIPLLIVSFTIRELVHADRLSFLVDPILVRFVKKSTSSSSSSTDSWRLDTNTNYTMDVNYWLNETEPADRHYYFNISTLVEKTPDGIARNLTVVNGQYPGPLLEANAGDTIYIHVDNQMNDTPVTIHCHGLFYNKQNNFQDGASFINQCPIPPNGSYTYEIELDENQYGTYWYHSHYGAQYADGLFGPLVIHSAEEYKALNSSYDKDIVIVVNDYYHDIASNYLPDYLGPDNENTEPDPDNGLIQGQNIFEYVQSTYLVPNGGNISEVSYSPVNVSVIDLDPKSTYRLRLLNAGFFLPFEFEIDRHTLKVIEADGTLLEPLTVDSISVSVAQRYSFILQPLDDTDDLKNYWMHAMFDQFCAKEINDNFNAGVTAIVTYEGSEDDSDLDVPSSTWQYDGGEVQCRDFDQSLLHTLNATSVPKTANGTNLPDIRIDLDVAFFIRDYQKTRGYFNDHTYYSIENGSTLYQLAFAADDNTIKNLNVTDLTTTNENQYLINLNERGTVVDFMINNYDDGSHPFHLHGHKFWVLKVGNGGYFKDSYYDDDAGMLNFDNPVLRDTVNIPGFGWGVIRFVVDNPGVWPFHCHIGWHIESGLLLQVNSLQEEYSNWNNYPDDWYEHCQYWQDQL